MDLQNNKGTIDIIKDADGKSLVIINDIRFKGDVGLKTKNVNTFLKNK